MALDVAAELLQDGEITSAELARSLGALAEEGEAIVKQRGGAGGSGGDGGDGGAEEGDDIGEWWWGWDDIAGGEGVGGGDGWWRCKGARDGVLRGHSAIAATCYHCCHRDMPVPGPLLLPHPTRSRSLPHFHSHAPQDPSPSSPPPPSTDLDPKPHDADTTHNQGDFAFGGEEVPASLFATPPRAMAGAHKDARDGDFTFTPPQSVTPPAEEVSSHGVWSRTPSGISRAEGVSGGER